MSNGNKKILGPSRRAAKQLKKLYTAGDEGAVARVKKMMSSHDVTKGLSLQSAQNVIAREKGHLNWNAMLNSVRERKGLS